MRTATAATRTERQELGLGAEDAAVAYLVREGYRIRARNWSCRYGELDIVAEHDGVLCFVEVRMRSSVAWGDPSQTVTFSKQRKVVKTALYYLGAGRFGGGSGGDLAIRFDVIAVVGKGASAVVEHIPDAFDAGM